MLEGKVNCTAGMVFLIMYGFINQATEFEKSP